MVGITKDKINTLTKNNFAFWHSTFFGFLFKILGSLFLIIGLIFFGLSYGIQTSSSINGALSQVSPQNSGVAIGLSFTIAMIGAMTGTSLTGIFLERFSHSHDFMYALKFILLIHWKMGFPKHLDLPI